MNGNLDAPHDVNAVLNPHVPPCAHQMGQYGFILPYCEGGTEYTCPLLHGITVMNWLAALSDLNALRTD